MTDAALSMPDGQPALLTVRGLHAGHGAVEVLHDVSLTVHAGEVVSLLGRNGAGRSTTLQAVVGLLPARGGVWIDGTDCSALPAHQRARLGLGYVPEGRDIFPDLSTRDNLLLGIKPGEREAAVLEHRMLQLFPALAERLRTPARALSGGEQQMLALARCLMGRPRVLLLDEPAEGLSPERTRALAALLASLRDDGLGVLLVEQRLRVARGLSARAIVLGNGQVRFTGTPADLEQRADILRAWL